MHLPSVPPPARRAAALTLLVPLLGGLLAGCSPGGGEASTSLAAPAAAARAQGAGSAAGGSAGGQAAAGKGVTGELGTLTLARDVVRTADLRVEVADVRRAGDAARSVAEGAGGGLEAEDASAGGSTLRLRVPPDRLEGALDGLARLGRETGRSVGSEDVTEQVADLDSRVATQRASVERVRALLARADALSDVVAVEAQLTERQADLESLQARLRAVRGRAELATLTLTLVQPEAAAAAPARGFADGLRAGVDAFLGVTRASAVVVGALLPFLPLVAVAVLLGRRTRRRPARVREGV